MADFPGTRVEKLAENSESRHQLCALGCHKLGTAAESHDHSSGRGLAKGRSVVGGKHRPIQQESVKFEF